MLLKKNNIVKNSKDFTIDLINYLESFIISKEKAHYVLKSVKRFKELSRNEREKELPAIYLLLEQYLTEVDTQTNQTKSRLRSLIHSKYNELEKNIKFKIILLNENDQKIELCKLLLYNLISNAFNILGATNDNILGKTKDWLIQTSDKNYKLPLIIEKITEETFKDLTNVYSLISLELYKIIEGKLGETSSINLYNNNYRKVAELYSRLDSFPTIIKLMPDKLLDEEKISLMNKQEIQNMLRLKIMELDKSNKNLEISNSENERLLLNILPEKIANELKETNKVEPVLYEEATILFTDFIQFTNLSENLSPHKLVEELSESFEGIDKIIKKHNIEKLKTIGDSYMAASGIVKKNKTHAIDCTLAALDIMQYMRNVNYKITRYGLRIGINTGTVIAGIVGKKRFAFDIWGHAVNIAARMEAASDQNMINISSNTYNLIKDYFVTEYRGKIKTKHEGEMDMYFVKGIKPELSEENEGKITNYKFIELYNKLKNI